MTSPIETNNVVELVEALKNIARAMRYGPDQAWIEEAADLIQSLSDRIDVLEKQRLMILAAVYKEAPAFVATICDESLDRSGALLGQVRELVRAALSPLEKHPEGA